MRTAVDLEYLCTRRACSDQREDFYDLFDVEPVEVTVETCMEYWDRFDFAWAALHLLNQGGWDEVQGLVRQTELALETIERCVDAGEVPASVDYRREELSEDHLQLVRAIAFAEVVVRRGLLEPGESSAHEHMLERAVAGRSAGAGS